MKTKMNVNKTKQMRKAYFSRYKDFSTKIISSNLFIFVAAVINILFVIFLFQDKLNLLQIILGLIFSIFCLISGIINE